MGVDALGSVVPSELNIWSDCGLMMMHEDGTGSCWAATQGRHSPLKPRQLHHRHDHVSNVMCNVSSSEAINIDGEAIY